jgi:hypothetical protein
VDKLPDFFLAAAGSPIFFPVLIATESVVLPRLRETDSTESTLRKAAHVGLLLER